MNLRNLFILAVAYLAIPAGLALAHGENKPGPHGGHMRMPGAFHTELVRESDNSFFVYLVDIQFKNADTKSSSLSMVAKTNEAEIELSCKAQSERFLCKLPDTKSPGAKIGKLIVKAKYLGFPEGAAIYNLPLQFEQSSH